MWNYLLQRKVRNKETMMLQILIVLCFCRLSVQSVSFSAVGGVINDDIFLCGDTVHLICKTDPNPQDIIFNYGSTQVAACSFGRCTTNSNYTGSFNMSLANGIFNLTIVSVRLSDNLQKITCNVEGTEYTIFPYVAGNFEDAIVKIAPNRTLSETEITAQTGCMFPTSNITFSWFTVKISNLSDVEPFQPTDFKTVPDNSLCQASLDCEGSGLSYSFKINEHGTSTRGKVYLEVRVSHGYAPESLTVINRTEEFFVIADSKPDAPERSTEQSTVLSTGAIIGIITGACVVACLAVIIFVSVIKYRKHVRVQSAPDTPKYFVVKDVSEISVTFSCTPVLYPGGQIITLCYVCTDGGKEDFEGTLNIRDVKGGEPINITATGLKPNHQYRCYVVAVNSRGVTSAKSEDVAVTTLGKPESPTRLDEQNEEKTSSSITVSWKPGTYRRNIQRFIIKYGLSKKNVGNIKWEQAVLLDDPSRDTLSYKITGLKPGKKYIISIIAQNDYGSTDMTSRPLKVRTNYAEEDLGKLTEI